MLDLILRVFAFLLTVLRGRLCVCATRIPATILPSHPYSRMVSETSGFPLKPVILRR
jgi:hypothetical protein